MVLVCLSSDALSQYLPSYLVSLTLQVGYLFTAPAAKRSHCSLPWTRSISSWLPLLTWKVEYLLSALLRGPAAALWMWGSSSQLLLRLRSLALLVSAPDLGRRVAPHSHASVRSTAAGMLLKINNMDKLGGRYVFPCLFMLLLFQLPHFVRVLLSKLQHIGYHQYGTRARNI